MNSESVLGIDLAADVGRGVLYDDDCLHAISPSDFPTENTLKMGVSPASDVATSIVDVFEQAKCQQAEIFRVVLTADVSQPNCWQELGDIVEYLVDVLKWPDDRVEVIEHPFAMAAYFLHFNPEAKGDLCLLSWNDLNMRGYRMNIDDQSPMILEDVTQVLDSDVCGEETPVNGAIQSLLAEGGANETPCMLIDGTSNPVGGSIDEPPVEFPLWIRPWVNSDTECSLDQDEYAAAGAAVSRGRTYRRNESDAMPEDEESLPSEQSECMLVLTAPARPEFRRIYYESLRLGRNELRGAADKDALAVLNLSPILLMIDGNDVFVRSIGPQSNGTLNGSQIPMGESIKLGNSENLFEISGLQLSMHVRST